MRARTLRVRPGRTPAANTVVAPGRPPGSERRAAFLGPSGQSAYRARPRFRRNARRSVPMSENWAQNGGASPEAGRARRSLVDTAAPWLGGRNAGDARPRSTSTIPLCRAAQAGGGCLWARQPRQPADRPKPARAAAARRRRVLAALQARWRSNPPRSDGVPMVNFSLREGRPRKPPPTPRDPQSPVLGRSTMVRCKRAPLRCKRMPERHRSATELRTHATERHSHATERRSDTTERR